jgi:hypothetical protein
MALGFQKIAIFAVFFALDSHIEMKFGIQIYRKNI